MMQSLSGPLAAAAVALALTAATPVLAQAERPAFTQEGQASYFTAAGEGTKSGETLDPNQLTAAHPTLPLGSMAKVTNTRTGQSVEVRIIDRGPVQPDRAIDVSRRAAEALGMVREGVAPVRIEAFAANQPNPEVRRSLEEMAQR